MQTPVGGRAAGLRGSGDVLEGTSVVRTGSMQHMAVNPISQGMPAGGVLYI
jgi:hypothetical protein